MNPSDSIPPELISCMRRGARAEYDEACATMYRARGGTDEEQIREWLAAEERAERHEALLNTLGPEHVDIAPSVELHGEHTVAVREALTRYARDFPEDPLRKEIEALRREMGDRKRGLRPFRRFRTGS